MKKLLLGSILLTLVIVVPIPAMAEVNVNIGIGIPLPPPVVFAAPPAVVVIPDAYGVYVIPDIAVDIFFWNGWWWRPWEGRWYRSHYYDRGWAYYNAVPRFYFDVDPGWRRYYRERSWYGHRWNYEPIPYQRLNKNWKTWSNNRYWEKQKTWGVQGYQPRPQQQRQELRHQRQQEYQKMPEVQRHQQQMREQQKKQPQVRQPQKQRQPQQEQHGQPRVQQPQSHQQQSHPQGQQRQGESQHQKSQGKPERGDEGHSR